MVGGYGCRVNASPLWQLGVMHMRGCGIAAVAIGPLRLTVTWPVHADPEPIVLESMGLVDA